MLKNKNKKGKKKSAFKRNNMEKKIKTMLPIYTQIEGKYNIGNE